MRTQSVPPLKLYSVIQNFDTPKIDDVESYLTKELEKVTSRVAAGSKIAVAVGSRGIFGIDRIVQTTVRCLKRKNAEPFVVPAMGSHGCATAKGQMEVLSSYGVRESNIGAPIRSSADVISRRLYDKIDFQSMLENAYTSSFLSRAKVPIVAESDE